jgi:hypothetical protein
MNRRTLVLAVACDELMESIVTLSARDTGHACCSTWDNGALIYWMPETVTFRICGLSAQMKGWDFGGCGSGEYIGPSTCWSAGRSKITLTRKRSALETTGRVMPPSQTAPQAAMAVSAILHGLQFSGMGFPSGIASMTMSNSAALTVFVIEADPTLPFPSTVAMRNARAMNARRQTIGQL